MFSIHLNKFKIFNETNNNLKKEIKYMKKVLKYASKKEGLYNTYFNVIIVDNPYIKEINKKYRNIDRETDVISFALLDEEKEVEEDKVILGDIYISIDKAISQSKEYGHSLIRELCFLSVHGLLHLLGYDHMNKEDEKEMFEKQEMILNEQGIKRIKEK